jgi:hypothetical protein
MRGWRLKGMKVEKAEVRLQERNRLLGEYLIVEKEKLKAMTDLIAGELAAVKRVDEEIKDRRSDS